VLSASVVACGIFGATDEPSTEAPPGTPQENAQPPVGGAAPVGIFVSSSQGQDDGTGSSVNPAKTLKQAFALAKARGLRVIACAEEYKENVVLVDGVSAFGYYDCKKTPWEQGTARATVRAPASPAVLGEGINAATRIAGFEFRAPDLDGAPATDTVGTSIGLEVRNSAGLIVSESLVHGGKGAPGTDGVVGLTNDRTKASDGASAGDQRERVCSGAFAELCSNHHIYGGAGGKTTCTIGPSGGPGGNGGDGRNIFNRTTSDVPGDQRGGPLAATTLTAVGGLNTSATGIGLPGAKGANGAEGMDGANGAWVLTAKGFVRGNGSAGSSGSPGQGGGGGAGTGSYFGPDGIFASPPAGSTNYATATGGGGGGGGCGGQAGTPATGGGASIGALVIASVISFEHSRIESSSGGAAGKGNLGTAGIVGGTGGLGTSHGGVLTTGKGGDGGPGGSGGASGHGAPGPSIVIAYSGTKPTKPETDLVPGPAGAGQPELSRMVGGTVGTKLLPAVIGQALVEYEIKP
jgi:hypothetical protein